VSAVLPPPASKARARFIEEVRGGLHAEYRIHQVGTREALMQIAVPQQRESRYRDTSETVTLIEWLEPDALEAPVLPAAIAALEPKAITGPALPHTPHAHSWYRELPFGLLHAVAVYPIQIEAFQQKYSFFGYTLITALAATAWAMSVRNHNARTPSRRYLWLAPLIFVLQVAIPAASTPDYYMKWWNVAYMFPVWCLSLLPMQLLEHATAKRSAIANADVHAAERVRANVLLAASALAFVLVRSCIHSDSEPVYLLLTLGAGLLACRLRWSARGEPIA
jgi:hypothetical protein